VSFQAVTAALALRGMDVEEKFLLVAIASYADTDHTCFPAQSTLAEDTGMSTRTILRRMKNLEARGLLKRSPRYAGGHRKTDLLTLLFIPARQSVKAPPIGDRQSVHTRQNPRFIGDCQSEEPVIEPRIEPCAREASAGEAPASRAQIGLEMRALAESLGARHRA
jgi:DNA-binding transcriptional MocR family regulator